MSTTEFRAVRQPSTTVDGDLYEARVIRSFNRSASRAILHFADDDGAKIDDWAFYQKTDVEVTTNGGSTWADELNGMAVDRTRKSKAGPNQLEVGVYSFDNLLRHSVNADFTSTTISSILQSLIENQTAATWNASNVTVTNDKTISREFKGERIDAAIAYLAAESGDEEFGVNSSLEFFFQPQDSTRAAAIGDDDVIDYDLPEEGRRVVNRYELFYTANGNQSVVVDDRESQQDLKDKLGAARGVQIKRADTMPEITDEARAEEIAKQRLGDAAPVQTGTVTVPLGRFDTDPGDVVELTISEAGISQTDFRVAQIEHEWGKNRTTLTIAENANDIEELLVGISDNVENVRMRDADLAATQVFFQTLRSGVTATLSTTLTTKTSGGGFVLGQSQLGQGTDDTLGGSVGSTSTVTVTSQKATVGLLNLLRDLWQDGNAEFIDLSHLGVGTDNSAATRADSSLQSEVDRVAVEKFGKGNAAETAEFVATIPPGGAFAEAADLAEFAIADADSGGSIYARVTFADTTIDATTRLKAHLEITFDVDSDQQGVVTSTGQQRIRDLLVGESNHQATDMVYGTGTSAFTESATSLGSKQHEDTIDSTADREPGVADIIERITSGDADTTNFSEVGLENAANELLQAVVFEAYDADFVIETVLQTQFTNA